MSKSNNPASRLYELLKNARGMGQDKPIREVWATVAGISPSDYPRVLRFVADLIILSQEAKGAIENLENVDHDIYLSPFKNVEQALARINLDDRWESFSRYLDEPTMVSLSFCADTLSRSSSNGLIPNEELDSLLLDIEQVLEQIINLELPDELRMFLVEHLEQMRAAVLSYRIFGNEGLRRALESVLGATILNQEAIKRNMVIDENQKMWGDIWKIIQNLANSLNAVESIKSLSEPIIAFLTGGK